MFSVFRVACTWEVALITSAFRNNLQITRSISTTAVLERNRKRQPWFAMPPIKIKKLVSVPEYTVDPIPIERFGGRNEEGKVITRRGGGDKRVYYMVDYKRPVNEDGSPVVERVLELLDDPNRSAKLAMVARGEHKRYIIATENMSVGDIIRTHSVIPRTPVKAMEGDTHPLGALPTGTMVSCVQLYPGPHCHGKVAGAAGVAATLVKKVDGRCIIKLPSKREINVDERCMATVGRVSNIEHNKKQYGKAGAKRWAGIRPRSGWWQRKDARFGRKPKRVKPVTEYTELPSKEHGTFTFTVGHGLIPCRRNKADERYLITFPETYPFLNKNVSKNPNLLKPKRKNLVV